MQYTLSNDNFEVIVDSKGCEIVSVIRKSDNKQYIWSGLGFVVHHKPEGYAAACSNQ